MTRLAANSNKKFLLEKNSSLSSGISFLLPIHCQRAQILHLYLKLPYLTLCSGCRSHSFNKRLSQLSASFLLMLEGLEEEKNLIHNSIFALVLFSNLRNMQKHEKDVQLWVVLSCDVLTLACQENLHYMHNLLCCRYLH